MSQVDALAGIAVKTYKQNYSYLWFDNGEAYIERIYNKAALAADLAQPDAHYFFVYDGNEIIGYFRIEEKAYPGSPKQSGLEISKLYLLQRATGKGVGKKIMRFIFDWAQNQRCLIVWLMVMESSPAKTFYESFGFKQTERAYLDYPNMIDGCRWILTMVAGNCK